MHGMRPFGALVSKEDALARLLAAAVPIARTEELALADAAGRACAEDVAAGIAVPPFDRATMDGYALRAADGTAPRRVVGEVPAGATDLPRVGPGEAARIATGAPVPPGADAVVRVEDTHEAEGRVTLKAAPRVGQSIDPAGADLRLGAPVCARGDPLTPARLGLLASVGRASVRVLARPRVALLASGDELLRPGDPPRPLRIYDSNSTSLRAALASAGAKVEVMAALPDSLEAQREALRSAARGRDLVVLSGGASVGARDLAADALRAEGEVLFHGVRVKPGKPLLAGRVGACLVVGLPGNPTSALSNALIFLVPVVRRLAGLPPPESRAIRANLAQEVRGEPDRYQFLPVRLEEGRAALNEPAGSSGSSFAPLTAVPTFKGSGSLTSMAGSDGWIGVPEGATLPAGTPVEVHPW